MTILRYDDWDDVFNFREYLELGTKGNDTNSNNNGGCLGVIFWIVVIAVICSFLLLKM